eukprot:364312-Chlamydomonas_euryale.AAC.4
MRPSAYAATAAAVAAGRSSGHGCRNAAYACSRSGRPCALTPGSPCSSSGSAAVSNSGAWQPAAASDRRTRPTANGGSSCVRDAAARATSEKNAASR